MIYAVASGKGGAGKSFVVANLSIILSKCNYKVLCVDADVGLSNLGLLFGIEGKYRYTWRDVVNGDVDFEDVKIEAYGVDIVPVGLTLDNIYGENRLDDFIRFVSSYDYDFIFIDCPAGLDTDIMTAIDASDQLLIVVNPEVTSIVDAFKTYQMGKRLGKPLAGVVVNRVGLSKTEVSRQQIERIFGKILGVIPHDRSVVESINKGIPYVVYRPESKITHEFARIAESLTGVRIEIVTRKEKEKEKKRKIWF